MGNQNSRENISNAKNMAKVPTTITTNPNIMATGKTTTSLDGATTHGWMAENTSGPGSTITCTDLEFTPGIMAENMRECTLRTKKMATASTPGQMVDNTTGNGKTACSMGTGSTSISQI